MANVSANYGFAYVRSHGAEPKDIECAALTGATDLYVGDPVVLSGSGDSFGRPSVTRAGADTTTVMVFGVIQGVKATGPDNLHKQYSDSADTIIVKPTLPGTVWRVNSGEVGGHGFALNDIAQRLDHIVVAGSTLTGRSGYYLDMGGSTGASNTSNCWLILQPDRRPDNEFSTTVSTDTDNVDLLVMCIESTWVLGNGVA